MSALPETRAAESVGSLLSRFADAPYLSEQFWTGVVGAKAVASRDALRGIFDALDRDPKRLGDRGTVLKQQREATVDDLELLDEDIHLLLAELATKRAMRDQIAATRVPEYDPDERAERSEDAQRRERRQDDRASREAVRP